MPSGSLRWPCRLDLRAGDLVEVRSRDEILSTLDGSGTLDGLLFMPEMLAYCGKRFTVSKRADKTCDTVKDSGLRRMTDTVHLSGTRCDGSAHSGCQAACLIFWKEAWLRPVSNAADHPSQRPSNAASSPGGAVTCTEQDLHAATRRKPEGNPPEEIYRCQNTDLREASTPLSPWSLSQYVRDIRSGNAKLGEILRAILWSVARYGRYHIPGYRVQIWLYHQIHRFIGGLPLLDVGGKLEKTPAGTLGLAPGELVQVKSLAEIRGTLNPSQRNRGLYFDLEMTPFCGGEFVVRSRVSRIINEKTGRLISLPGDCVILEGAACTGRYHGCCPRAIYPYWREIWLRRVSEPSRE